MPELPSTLSILGTRWTVEVDPTIYADDEEWGNTNSRSRTIKIAPEADQPATLLHEVLHAVEHAQDLDLKDREVHLLARGLAAVINDNPDFRAWLLKGTR